MSIIELSKHFEGLPLNTLTRGNCNERVIKESFSAYDIMISKAYETAFKSSEETVNDLDMRLIPDEVKEKRTNSLIKKIEEYDNRLFGYYTIARPYYLAPEQVLYVGYGERLRRGMLKMIIDRGGINTGAYCDALQKVEGRVDMREFFNSVAVINDYLTQGKTGSGTGLPE